MISQFYHKMSSDKRWPMLILMLVSTIFCMALIAYRMKHTGHGFYRFLNWNLFLAWIPFAVSTLLWVYREKVSNLMLVAGIGLWLLFFPNAPYILTDLIHLSPKESVPFWFDLVLILSFAWTGLMVGLLSLQDIHNLVMQRSKPWFGWACAIAFIGLGAFGVYLGRYLRFNSWEFFTDPRPLFHEVADRFVHPLHYGTTYKVTLLFFIFLLLAYLGLRFAGRMQGRQVN
jgi:uncharacterized membrane protein